MSKKNTLIASAVLAGLFSGMALAEEVKSTAPAEKAKIEEAGKCEGDKSDCKGMNKKGAKKKADKHACGGPNGCHGASEVAKDEKAK